MVCGLTIGVFYHNIMTAKDFIMDEKQEIITSVAEMTAGEMLKNARTTGRRKREIATIAKLLCIREEFLTALEEGDYRKIPENVYILGFARSYAVELGLNPDEVIAKLKRELGIVVEDKKSTEEKRQEKVEEKKQEKIEKVDDKKEECFCINKETGKKEKVKIVAKAMVVKIKPASQYVKKHWIWFASGVAVVLIALVLGIVLLRKHPSDVNPASNESQDVVAVESVAETVKEPDFRYPVREKFNDKVKKESRVVLQAEKESWIKIEDARGNTVFSRVLVPGDVYYMPLSDKFKGTFGNAGAIDVWVDGQLVNKVGPANTRKSGISMAPDALKTAGLAE